MMVVDSKSKLVSFHVILEFFGWIKQDKRVDQSYPEASL